MRRKNLSSRTGLASLEALESRRLLSGQVSLAPALTDMPNVDGLYQKSGYTQIEWQGNDVWVKPGSWTLSLERPKLQLFPSAKSQPVVALPTIKQIESLGFDIRVEVQPGDPYSFTLRTPPDVDAEALKQSVSKLAGVADFGPNVVYTANATLPTDQLFPYQYGLNNTGQTGGMANADIDGPEAWDLTTGSPSVVVAVLDTGVDYTHTDLARNIWLNPDEVAGNGIDDDGNGYVDDTRGWDFVNGDANPMDDNAVNGIYHGTHVAGIIGAEANGTYGIAGTAWNIQLMPIKVLDEYGNGDAAIIKAGIDYVRLMRARGVNVVVLNNSYGSSAYNAQLEFAVQQTADAGMLFVASAGNNSLNNDSTPQYPASFNSDNILSVAASDANDNLASFSNVGGASVDLAAPEVAILSTMALASGYPHQSLSGTSQAAPYVSGVAALGFALQPQATFHTVRQAIMTGVDKKAIFASTTASGGRLNAENTLKALASSARTYNGDLSGKPSNDTIVLRQDPVSPGLVHVLVNGLTIAGFSLADTTSVTINGLGGNDTLTVDESYGAINIPITLNGGTGNDTLTGGSGNDRLDGGAGGDILNGNGGDDVLIGGVGANTLNGGAGSNWIQGLSADFNGDGKQDILWRKESTGQVRVWLMNGDTLLSSVALPNITAGWAAGGMGDFNGDGKTDILWRNKTTGENRVWLMNGTTWSSTVNLPPTAAGTPWEAAGVADLNADGRVDILFRNYSTGANLLWAMNGTTLVNQTALISVADTNWKLLGAADMNGDNTPDLIWHRPDNGQALTWLMRGMNPTGVFPPLPQSDVAGGWRMRGAIDANADGKADLRWRRVSAPGGNLAWNMNNLFSTGTTIWPAEPDLLWDMAIG